MQSNATILNSMWLSGTWDYQQRVPSPTVATQAQQAQAIFAPGNGSIVYNSFVDTLVNRIGLSYARSQSWRNPLAGFKRGRLEYGSTVQEMQAKWVRAHSYEDDKQTLLKIHRPEIEAVYHVVNRFDQYPISLNKLELRQAFTTEYGLNELIASVMDAVISSANYDEFVQMKNLIAFYNDNWGFYKIQLAEPDDDETAKAFLKSLKSMVERLRFPSSMYNASIITDLPVFADPSECILLVTPEAAASVDVDALATLFHLEPADAQVRRVIVDSFPIPGAYAMLTTRDWFQVYDQVYENGSFYNPETLTTNYYLTIMQAISCSPFVPAIVWTTEAGTTPATITQTTDGQITMTMATRDQRGNFSTMDAATEITKAMVTGKNADGTYNDVDGVYLFGALNGELSDGTTTGAQDLDGISVRPDAYKVTGLAFSGDGAPAVNSRTYIDRNGRLHLQAGAFKSANGLTLTVTVVPVYTNPDGATPEAVPATVQFQIAAGNGGGGGTSDITSVTLLGLNGGEGIDLGVTPLTSPAQTGSTLSATTQQLTDAQIISVQPVEGKTVTAVKVANEYETESLPTPGGTIAPYMYYWPLNGTMSAGVKSILNTGSNRRIIVTVDGNDYTIAFSLN